MENRGFAGEKRECFAASMCTRRPPLGSQPLDIGRINGLCSTDELEWPSGRLWCGSVGAMMASERELWACANRVVMQHGDGAPMFVAERIGALALAGDWEGVAVWKAIAAKMMSLLKHPDLSQ